MSSSPPLDPGDVLPSRSRGREQTLFLLVSNPRLAGRTENKVLGTAHALLGVARARSLAVTNEVDSCVLPPPLLSRIYRDVLGHANQLVAAEAYPVMPGLPSS